MFPLILASLAGCNGGGNNNTGKVVINFWHTFGQKPEAALKSKIADFVKKVKDKEGVDVEVILWKITVPLLSPQILYLMITSFIGSFKEYTSVVAIFNGPGTMGKNSNIPDMETIVYYVYDNVEKGNTSRAAAAGVFLFIIILIFTFVQFGVSKKRVHY